MANETRIVDGDVKCDKIIGYGVALAFGRAAVSMTDANKTLSASEYDQNIIEMSGTLTTGRDVILPLTDGAVKIVHNKTGQTLTFKGATGTGVAVATAKVATIYCDGTNWYRASADVSP
ncbi:MAG TPA: hypothetical protein PLV39_13990 [Fimbriimonadaceae bacterium]|jgi:hypothetical protein|nr:hypothetical protein [Fimbriimonadaceae bacterium]